MQLDRTQWALERAIEALSHRHDRLADNIANFETPAFKRSDVAFKDELARALGAPEPQMPLATTHHDHLGRLGVLRSYAPRIIEDTATVVRADGNNVDVEHEMTQLARNTLEYDALISLASRRLGFLRTAITGGRR